MRSDPRRPLDELLDEVVALAPPDRHAWIEALPGEDLRQELRSLAAAHEASAGFFEALARRAVLPALVALPAEPDAGLASGEMVSHYRIERRIADGGMGVVYEARDLTLDRPVALKCLPLYLHGDPRATERLLAEARAASRLDHPHVGTIHEAGQTADGRVFIAMVRYEGETLAERIRRGALPARDALGIARQIAGALAAAHAHGIVHRDVKPSNVVLTRDGQAKLLDFGIARMPDAAGECGPAPGTLPYMSPEQTRGEPVDARSDIWSLGVVLHEMLTGERPFRGRDADAVARAIQEAPVPGGPAAGALPAALAPVVRRCLEKQPARRYASADALVADLDRASRARPGRGGGRLAAVLLTMVVLALLWAGGRVGRDPALLPGAPADVPLKRLAVLPLAPAGTDADRAHLAGSLTGELIAELAAYDALRVLSKASTVWYSNAVEDPLAAFRRLDVDALLTGQLTTEGDILELTLGLVGRARDQQGWSRTIAGRLDEMPAVLRQVAREVADALGVPSAAAARAARTSPAYGLYLRGRYHLERRDEESVQRARHEFLEALRADPTYAPALAGLSDAMALLAWLSVLPPEDAYPASQAAAERALDQDRFLADAHVSIARVLFRHRFRIREACTHLEEAIRLNRSHAEARQEYAACLRVQGLFDKALAEAETAAALEPLSPWHRVEVGLTYYMQHRYDEASREYGRVVATWPDFRPVHFFIALVHVQQQRLDEALASLDRAAPSRLWKDAVAIRGYVYAVSGDRDAAREQLRQLTRPESADASSPWYAAIIHLGFGDRARALDLLERAFELRAWQMPLLPVEPFLDPLREEPRFIALIDRLFE